MRYSRRLPMARALASAFLEVCPAQVTAGEHDALEQTLADVVAAARERYPAPGVEDTALVRHIAARVNVTDSAAGALRRAHAGDLLVAYASARGDRAALLLIESQCIRTVEGTLARRGISAEVIEEAQQNVRERLFVGGRERAPKILEYDGKGRLGGWIRVVLIREAIYLAKRNKRETPLAIDLLAIPDWYDNPESAYLKAKYSSEYKRAFQAAVLELSSRERALLRQQIVLGMSIDQIGMLYQVHRATAARWVQASREALLSNTRRNLGTNLGIARAEIESIVKMIESRLDVSMSRLLEVTKDESSGSGR